MNVLPLFVRVQGRRCLVVGGGGAAASKVRLLLKAGAAVTVVAPKVRHEIAGLAARGELNLVRRGFVPGDVTDRALVFAATGIAKVDARVAEAARAAGVPVNVVDGAEHSSFIMPAIVDRDPIILGISSGGAAPVLARKLRAGLEALLPADLGRLARFAESFRGAVKAAIPSLAARRRFWERFFEGPVAEAVLRGDDRGAREAMLSLVNRPSRMPRAEGVVHIVGAGPGDPDLLTLRALRLLQQADVVIHDRLVSPRIVDYARREAERIFVGKSKSNHSKSQQEINALMVRQAKAGKRVVRLKGGDPFVFGRGGEELEHLRREGIEAEVVPGITAATGCAAYTGIPLTHRDHAIAATFISGHAQHGEPDLDWAALARSRQTVVVYMGVSTAATIARRLIEHGMAPSTPAAVIENGTLPNQKLVVGSVAGLGAMIAENGIEGPALIVIGDVVRLADAGALTELAHAAAG